MFFATTNPDPEANGCSTSTTEFNAAVAARLSEALSAGGQGGVSAAGAADGSLAATAVSALEEKIKPMA